MTRPVIFSSIIIAGAVFCGLSCSDRGTDLGPTVPKLAGTWSLYKCFSIWSGIQTPQSTGHTWTEQFTTSLEHRVYIDDTLWYRSPYRIRSLPDGAGGMFEMVEDLEHDWLLARVIRFQHPDSLVLDDYADDATTWWFVRSGP